MSEVTYYVALPFVLSDEGVTAAEAIECFNPNAAVMKAEVLSRKEGYIPASQSPTHSKCSRQNDKGPRKQDDQYR